MATRYQKFIGGLLGEDVEGMSEEERKQLSRQGTTSAILGLLGGKGLLGGLGAYGEQREEKRKKAKEEEQAAIQRQLQVAIGSQLGEGQGMSPNLMNILSTPEGAAAVEANPMLKKAIEDRLGRQVVGGSIYDRGTGQFIKPPEEEKPRVPVREIDLGNVVEVYYSDGTVQTKRKGLAPGAAGKGGMPDLSKDERDRVFKARDRIESSSESIAGLQAARQLSNQAYEGPLAGARAQAAAALPDQIEPAGAKETIEFDMILKQQVLPQLKTIFGAAPTEGERKILLELQGSSSLPRAVRNKILDNAIAAANRRMRADQEEVESLLGGTYFRTPERGGPSMPKVPTPAASPKVDYIFRNGKLVKAE